MIATQAPARNASEVAKPPEILEGRAAREESIQNLDKQIEELLNRPAAMPDRAEVLVTDLVDFR